MRSVSTRSSMALVVKSANNKGKTDPKTSSSKKGDTGHLNLSIADGPSIGQSVQSGRIRVLKEGRSSGKCPVIYWMFRDQRSKDNWALIHAVDQANKMDAPVAVAFNLFDQFLGAKARQLGFMLRGLRELEQTLKALEIPFFLFQAKAVDTIPKFLNECNASLLVMDFSPLREVRKWKDEICKKVGESVAVHEVDTHNVVPIWVASEKLEYSARTIRTKIHKLLPEYLIDFPSLQPPSRKWMAEGPAKIDWEKLTADVLRKGAEVPELEWCEPGELAAMEVLLGSTNGFLTTRLKNYSNDRNNPLKPKGLSGLSPYLHFGQISSQRCALVARTFRKMHPQSVDAFLEEMIVRRELADNFCFYQPQYDSVQGAWEWAQKTLMDHAADKRDHLYTKDQLEKAKTADPFCRMYWAKKILEWTSGPEEALSIAIYLNDKYEIDGRDPNGYVGCMWSICGVHDQGWKERAVFGKIRYMNYAGCQRKFDVDGYISYVKRLVGETKKRKIDNPANPASKESRTLESV
ncbi:deoxyribodipyrimidine photo-lyase isoform X2 [Magnolia sinica]|uniref:deoxyribodipyrimidine photo-lyase isoform X2 n=1 Tax=Magnolia sinica TaxID=86752 RepID=UPI00265A6AC0|nr:deoxyribodipyrimidine photo-lyase isoform X2 [Magnolia sinica]